MLPFKQYKNEKKIFCFIPLSILFIDTRSFSSVHETWNFQRRHIGAAFWEILISRLQRKGKGRGEGIGGVQRGGGVQTITIKAWHLMIKCLPDCHSFQLAVHDNLSSFHMMQAFFCFIFEGTHHGWWCPGGRQRTVIPTNTLLSSELQTLHICLVLHPTA